GRSTPRTSRSSRRRRRPARLRRPPRRPPRAGAQSSTAAAAAAAGLVASRRVHQAQAARRAAFPAKELHRPLGVELVEDAELELGAAAAAILDALGGVQDELRLRAQA